jgi:hypothetical protein
LNVLIAQRYECQQLVQALHAGASAQILTALDELGKTVCGIAWPDLPRPAKATRNRQAVFGGGGA